MSDLNIESTLRDLGYNLQDRGDYWQSSAVFRNGDNPTALQIYKDSGVWKDYVEGDNFLPFLSLIEKTVGKENAKKLQINSPKLTKAEGKDEGSIVKVEKIFPKEDFENLLPHYSFYNKKGISNETLKFLKSGMCTGGSMYQRYIFPIFNKYQQIHGVAGRDMMNSSSRPKWKHMGKKTTWVYPLYNLDESGSNIVFSSIMDSKEVILVESVGDMLALFENGFKNVLVTFGLDISPKLISTLMGLNLKRICLSFNNDFNKENNSGLTACIKNFLKLLSYFSSDRINISLPIKNDFGDMNKEDFKTWQIKKDKNYLNQNLVCKKVLEFSKQMQRQKKLSKVIYSNIKKLPCYE